MKKLLFGLGAVSAVASGLSGKKSSLNILPQFGEMTRRQFLNWINPEDKYHPSDAYSRMSIDSENNPFTKVGLFETIGFVYLKGQRFSFEKLKTEEDTFVVWENISRNWKKPDYRVKMMIGRDSYFSFSKRAWKPEEDALLGTMTDEAVAGILAVSHTAVYSRRTFLKIPAFHSARDWTPDEIAILGKISDQRVGRLLGIGQKTVYDKRVSLGIPSYGKGR